jgi:hypothetical protein
LVHYLDRASVAMLSRYAKPSPTEGTRIDHTTATP